MNNKIIFRLAKPNDASQIAYVHLHIRDKYDQGFFAQVNKFFLNQYYKVMLEDPNEIVVCAEDSDTGRILGFCSGSLDASKQMATMRKNKFRFLLPLVSSALSNPSLIKSALDRFRSTKGESDNRYVSTVGPRLEYWGWLPDAQNGDSAVEMQEVLILLMKVLGAQKLFFEVDKVNKKVLKFHKLNGAEEVSSFTLPDGRERVELFYNMESFTFKYISI